MNWRKRVILVQLQNLYSRTLDLVLPFLALVTLYHDTIRVPRQPTCAIPWKKHKPR
jgi:hypothetical protein